jgi:hypothetical protein
MYGAPYIFLAFRVLVPFRVLRSGSIYKKWHEKRVCVTRKRHSIHTKKDKKNRVTFLKRKFRAHAVSKKGIRYKNV